MSPVPNTIWPRWVAGLCLAAGLLVLLTIGGCRRGVATLDASPKPAQPDRTISGVVSGPQGTSAIEGRAVDVIDVTSGERQRVNTSSTGGFAVKVKPGQYRVEVTLRDGESVMKGPGVIDVNRRNVDAHADFIVGTVRVSRPRSPAGRPDASLGPPIA